ncbi:UNVERIFIED_CONTAM: hypothetical protein PYX00_009525 [Menopon gallinae]|uniref:Uncharacterized protein n=1 Tax=Menopon gallinae TaxID=328185 RepID=A0AAW2HBS8_9NEOP
MGRGTICLLVVAFAGVLRAAEVGLENLPQTDVKEIEDEIAKGEATTDYTPSDKTKRGVAKLSNADAPTFNHLTSSSTTTGTSSVKTSTSSGQTPYRYLYNQYQTSPYISYIQSPQAAQIASQYSFQPAVHYLHTPTQIQYVSTPSIASRYQTVSSKVGGTTAATTATGTSASYQITPSQQVYIPQQSLYQTQSSGSVHQTTTGSQYTTPQQLYYQQQPIVMLLVQPQPTSGALLYPVQQQSQHQQQQTAYVLGQQPFFNVFGGHRFSLPYTVPNSQVTYLVPMAIQTATSAQATSGVKTASDKTTTSGIQTASSGVTYGVRTTKA